MVSLGPIAIGELRLDVDSPKLTKKQPVTSSTKGVSRMTSLLGTSFAFFRPGGMRLVIVAHDIVQSTRHMKPETRTAQPKPICAKSCRYITGKTTPPEANR